MERSVQESILVSFVAFVLHQCGGKKLANIKSAKKRVITNQKRAERNKAIRSKTKTAVKKVYAAIEAGDKAQALEALRLATVELDKAETKGVYHKNMTARKVSRLAKAVNKMA